MTLDETITDSKLENDKQLVHNHMHERNYFGINHIGKYADAECPGCIDKKPFNKFLDAFGKEETFYALTEDGIVLVNLGKGAPVSQLYWLD